MSHFAAPRAFALSRLVAIFALLLTVAGTSAGVARAVDMQTLRIENQYGCQWEFRVEVVALEKDRARGLMFRKSVPEGTGMLFDFQRQQPVSFWMKSTYVLLDMIFIRENGAIGRIAHDTTPLSENVIPSGVLVRYVLEVVAGTAKQLQIQPGWRSALGQGCVR
ncbi:DUF192 domain-containing protein [Breoghania sp.]|uniref:DUF192 domain-containing protein n=1 Tax=Breoghania sp. TaxID=2065378 RepID=UPI00261E6C52|nr:DUF192 domain-containing protein [Breoghania sp.]MDJ0929561.1 DUF192 domain-containing protein [Breoghania sp.]